MKLSKIGIGAAGLAAAGAIAIAGIGVVGVGAQTPVSGENPPARERLADGTMPGHRMGGLGFGHGMFGIHGALAEILGIEKETLRTELQSGKTLAQIGEEHGFDRETLIDRLTSAINQKLAQAVTDGKLTEERKAEILEALPERIEKALDATFPAMPDGVRPDGERPEGRQRPPHSGDHTMQPQ